MLRWSPGAHLPSSGPSPSTLTIPAAPPLGMVGMHHHSLFTGDVSGHGPASTRDSQHAGDAEGGVLDKDPQRI